VKDFESEIDLKLEQEEQEQEERDIQSRFFCALSNVLSTSDGRKVLKYIFQLEPIDNRNFSSDVIVNTFNEGRRDLILQIRDVVKNVISNDKLKEIDGERL